MCFLYVLFAFILLWLYTSAAGNIDEHVLLFMCFQLKVEDVETKVVPLKVEEESHEAPLKEEQHEAIKEEQQHEALKEQHEALTEDLVSLDCCQSHKTCLFFHG